MYSYNGSLGCTHTFVEPGSASACHGAGKVMGHPAPSWMWGAFGAMKAKNGFALFSGFVSASRTLGTMVAKSQFSETCTLKHD